MLNELGRNADSLLTMPRRTTISVALFALALAACGGSTAEETTTTSTTMATPEIEPTLLSYTLESGDVYEYEIDMSQSIEIVTEGQGQEFTDEEIPGSASVQVEGMGNVSYEVAEGPDPDTFAVTINIDFSDLEVSGTMDGEPIDDPDEVPELAEMEPVEVTVIVDEHGNITPADPDIEDPFSGLLGGMGDLGGLGSSGLPGTQMGQFFGPPFADREVAVGDTWSSSVENEGFGFDPITTTVASEVTGTDTIGSSEVFIIETTSTTSAFEFDFGQFFIGLFTGFLPEDPSAEEQAEIDALIENLRFILSSDESVADSVTYFDPEVGITRQFEVTSSSNISMDMNFPDEETGEMVGFVMDMSISQTINHRLVSGPTA